MRLAIALLVVTAVHWPVRAAGLDPEAKAPYQLRIVIRTGDHPTLTRHFRSEVLKNLSSSLQAALGALGNVEVADLNSTPADERDPLWQLVDEKGLEALDNVSAGSPGKTHFVFIDFVDGTYEIRTRQYDGTTGFSTPMVRKASHGDRGFVGRLAGLSIAQDFGMVGTFDPTGVQVSVVLKAGELGPVDAWVKKGDVFAVVQIKEGRRPLPRPQVKTKGKDPGKKGPPAPSVVGTRLDGVLLHVIDGPRNGLCVCKLYNRYKGQLPFDSQTLGYRAVKLGTGEGKLKLQLTDAAGSPHRGDALQPRVGVNDFPGEPREREEMTFADGIYTSKESFKNIAFVVVNSGSTVAARMPVEIYPDRIAVRKVNLNPAAELAPAVAAYMDMLDRVRSARVIQAKAFEMIAALQQKERQKALDFGMEAQESLSKEADAFRADLTRLKERYKAEAAPGLFDPCEADLKALEMKTRELRAHMTKLREVIRIESDPATAAARKKIEGLLLDAKVHAQSADLDKAIAKYEEALTLAQTAEPSAAEEINRALVELKKLWEVKSPEHANARKYIYETWATLALPAEVKTAVTEGRKAFQTCRALGDGIGLMKMYQTGPQILERYAETLKKALEDAVDDDERKTLAGYEKVTDDFNKLLNDIGKALGADPAK